jgi:uncharacterized protein with von Willebrand factor type A (vWA) domain
MSLLPDDLSWLTQALDGPPRSPQNIDGVKADRFAWENATQDAPAVRTLIESHSQWSAFPALLQDYFQIFYKMAPTLRPASHVDPASAVNRPYVEQLLQEPATQETRTQTRLDELASAIATLSAGQKIAEHITEHPDWDQAMQQPADPSAPPPPASGALAKAIRRAVKQAGQDAQDVQMVLTGWGLNSAALQSAPLGERLNLARTLMQPRFRRMADLIGRLRNLARARQGGSLRHLRDEYYRTTQGQDLSRVLPVELSALTDPVRALDFGRRFLESQLAQYDVKPIQREGRGPILCAIDCSASMAQSAKIEWASAVGLALVDTARRQKRDFGAVFFNRDIVAEFLFPKGQAAPADILRFAQVGPSGGTDFEPPLTWAMQQLETARFKTADITFITDGENRITDDFLQRLQAQKRAWGFRIFSILIGGTAEELSRWSDRVWALQGQPDDEAAGDVFAELVAM